VFKRTEHDRGIVVARHCVFNDLSLHLGDTDDVAPGPDPGDARRALGGTRFATLPSPPIEEILLILLQQVNEELVIGGLTRDAALLPAGEIETLLRGTESLLVAAAAGDVRLDELAELTGVRPVERGPGWLLVDRSWIELDAIQRLLADALPAPARAFAVPGHDGPGLVAYVAADGGITSAEQAHEACMRVLRGPASGAGDQHGPRTAAVAPGDYVICTGPPADPADLAAWQRQPVVARGSGR
jgi:hypothetical protein